VHTDTLNLLRCPFCGGRLELVTSSFHRTDGDKVLDGILGCHCCTFPVVSGIPVLHLQPQATSARDEIQAGRPDLARRTMLGLLDDEHAVRFEAVARSDVATYRELVDALGPNFEGGYFLYRFSDPTYIVANAVVRTLAAIVLRNGGRAVDRCGVAAGSSAGRPVFCEGVAGAAVHRAGLRTGVLRRQFPDAVRPWRVPSRDVFRRVPIHLDEAPVHRRVGASHRI
jgi:uncharacterized protein YbaR (Trm112 family)